MRGDTADMCYYMGLLIGGAISIVGALLGILGFVRLGNIVMGFGVVVILVDVLGFWLLVIPSLGGEDEE